MSTAETLLLLARERKENHVDQAALWAAYRAVMPGAVALFARGVLADVARANALRDRCRDLDARIVVARTPGPAATALRQERDGLLTSPQSPEVLAGGLEARRAQLDAQIAALERPSLEAEELGRQREKLHLEAVAIEATFPFDVMKREEAEVLAKGQQDGGPFRRLLSFLFGDREAQVSAEALGELLLRLEIPAARHRQHIRAWIAAGRAKVKIEALPGLTAEVERIETARRAAWARVSAAGAEVKALAQELHSSEQRLVNASVADGELGRLAEDYPEIFTEEAAGPK
jgi:hypothetical protein